VGTPDEAAAEVQYRRATVSPRRRLLQRFSVNPEGIRFLVDMRAELQPHLKADKRLLALDAEMEYMFSTWFDVGFLELRRISWDSPASLIEKLIKYEAVHDIRSWADMKNRLDSDRRCYGFFHPRLPDEPLIFVEVALMDDIADSITPLLDEAAAPADLKKATTAIFYSISNTQTGLRGVSFGDSLIKHVVDTLKQEFPRLKTFATLSPIPGLRAWLDKNAPANWIAAVGERGCRTCLKSGPERQALMGWAARYLGARMAGRQAAGPGGALSPGQRRAGGAAELGGDPSPKGLKQSYGLMVNYLYDLKKLDRHRALLAQGKIPVSGGHRRPVFLTVCPTTTGDKHDPSLNSARCIARGCAAAPPVPCHRGPCAGGLAHQAGDHDRAVPGRWRHRCLCAAHVGAVRPPHGQAAGH
jgi:malonyl-CoA decarboxylase